LHQDVGFDNRIGFFEPRCLKRYLKDRSVRRVNRDLPVISRKIADNKREPRDP
jgi:hypothetical protein